MNKTPEDIQKAVTEFYDALLAYVRTRVNDKETAQDIVQEVMYRLTRAKDKGGEINNIRAWLYQTTRYVIADHYRDIYKKTTLEAEETEQSEHDVSGFAPGDCILHMIGLLPERYSKPLLWNDIHNIPQKKIAELLNISLSAAKMRVQRGRKKLHELYLECCDIIYDRNGNFVDCTVRDHCEPLLRIEEELKRNTGC